MRDELDRTIVRQPVSRRTRIRNRDRGTSRYEDGSGTRDARDRLRSGAGQAGTRSSQRYGYSQPVSPRRKGVPVPLVILLMVCSVGLSAVLTNCVVQSGMAKTNEELAAVQEQVISLTRQIEQKDRELQAARSTTATAEAAPADAAGTTTASVGVDSPWTTTGRFTSGDATLDEEVKDFCDSKADTSMSQADAALEVYKGIAWSDYQERDNAQHPSGPDWRLVYARQYYENGCSGNCYEFASFLMYCLQYMGFSDAKAEGVLVELQSGGWGDHGIVYVTDLQGNACICDTARGTNAWMIPESTYNVQLQDFENA